MVIPGNFGMKSRRHFDEGKQWHIDWYNSVRSFAQNHYGRTYYYTSEALDEVEVIDAAWCNLENATEDVKHLGIFWDPINNKLRAHARLPVGDVEWGANGEDHPTDPRQFTRTNEFTYVPIDATLYKKKDSEVEDSVFVASLEKAVVITLPNNAMVPHTYTNATLVAMGGELDNWYTSYNSSDTDWDYRNPYWAPVAVTSVEAVVPIRVKRRYGYEWPSTWASGTGSELDIIVDDALGPWNYEQDGAKTSWQRMDLEAKTILESKVATRDSVTFAEVTRIGLPYITFDTYANQEKTTQGYGIVSHGITSINVTKNTEGWWQTKYSIKSHTPQLLKAKPYRDPTFEAFQYTNKVVRRTHDKVRNEFAETIQKMLEINRATRPQGSYTPTENEGLGKRVDPGITAP